ncbi:hypothetical protein WME95_17760 [Sorangium sp. So ce327]|jgi:hypothetical protein|uniref:hypothetical protein n=1 Tax=unclassified Sorangium TaxID=2621164 RepID=UPI003F62F9ED
MILSQLLDPKIYSTLTADDVDKLEAVLTAEIASNPEIQKLLKARIDKFVPHFKGTIKGTKKIGG